MAIGKILSAFEELASELRFRARALFRKETMERELRDELEFHIEREAEKLERAGVAPDEARRRARVAFGGVERMKEEARAQRGIGFLERLTNDVRLSSRSLAARPAFTAVIVLTLALGIGANAAMFGVIDRFLFRTPPYMTDASRVHRLVTFWTYDGKESTIGNHAYARYVDFQRDTRAFDIVAATSFRTTPVGTGDDTRELPIGVVSASFFRLFDAPPALGRYFTVREDTLPVGTPVAVLGYGYWQGRYGGRTDVLGQALMVGANTYTIIGVAPRGFVGLNAERPPAVYVPITYVAAQADFLGKDRSFATTYGWTWLEMIGRRRPGVSVQAATADLSQAMVKSYQQSLLEQKGATPIAEARPRAVAAPLQRERGPEAGATSKVARLVSGVSLVVLLIAAANVANLLLARAMQRRREIALRLALGVSRGRLLAQLLTESLLLAALGGGAGLAVAHWATATLRSVFLGSAEGESIVDPRTIAFAATLALVTGIVTGLAPALHAGREDLNTVLKSGMREGTYRRSRLRGALLLLQGTLSVVLLIGAGLFVRSFDRVMAFRLGYDVEPVLYVSPNMRGTKLSEQERAALAVRLRDEASALPGVASATRASTLPFWNTWSTSLEVAGIDSVRKLGDFTLQAGDATFFETMGTRILRGRGIEAGDVATSERVVVVSQGMAKAIWPNENAIGKCIGIESDSLPCARVVGIAEDIRQSSLTEPREFQYYLPSDQFHPDRADLIVRASGDAAAITESLRARLQRVMPGTGYVTVTPMQEVVSGQQRSFRVAATMFTAFGLLSLVLAAVGLYSVIAYDVAQRSHELGVRIALGARVGHVVRLVVSEGVRFAAIGIAIGGAIAFGASSRVEPLLFEQSPRDPVVYAVVTVTLLLVAVAATVVPALRATRVDPNRSLRTE